MEESGHRASLRCRLFDLAKILLLRTMTLTSYSKGWEWCLVWKEEGWLENNYYFVERRTSGVRLSRLWFWTSAAWSRACRTRSFLRIVWYGFERGSISQKVQSQDIDLLWLKCRWLQVDLTLLMEHFQGTYPLRHQYSFGISCLPCPENWSSIMLKMNIHVFKVLDGNNPILFKIHSKLAVKLDRRSFLNSMILASY